MDGILCRSISPSSTIYIKGTSTHDATDSNPSIPPNYSQPTVVTLKKSVHSSTKNVSTTTTDKYKST